MRSTLILTTKNIEDLIDVVLLAGNKILLSKKFNIKVNYKKNGSPVSCADNISHNIILDGLKKIFKDRSPIISEEDFKILPSGLTKNFWLVDPLDGTKDFIMGGEEYTVNVALISNGTPIFGIIYQPEKDFLYWGGKSIGVYKRFNDIETNILEKRKKIEITQRVVVSKSHASEKTLAFLSNFKEFELIKRSSSIKFCDLVENYASFYPRIGPTYEWDTAAGHAILEGSGGRILDLNYNSLKYGKQDFLNDGFIAINNSFTNQIDYIKASFSEVY